MQPGAVLLQDFIVSSQVAVHFSESEVAVADVLVVKEEVFPFWRAV